MFCLRWRRRSQDPCRQHRSTTSLSDAAVSPGFAAGVDPLATHRSRGHSGGPVGRLTLVCDDDEHRDHLVTPLGAQGHRVTVLDEPNDRTFALLADTTDVIVVIGPPSYAHAVSASLRRAGLDVSILIVDSGTKADCVAGLHAGADDYLTAPCYPDELFARIRALLRRHRDYRVR